MFSCRTLKVFFLLLAGYCLLLAPAAFRPSYLDSPLGLLLAGPYLCIYLFHGLGIPGLLQHDGHCGWGWCAPTSFGWFFLGAFWGAVVWLMAAGIAAISRLRQQSAPPRPDVGNPAGRS